MIPLIVQRVARYSRGIPFLSRIVPGVPFVPARNPAFVSPNVGLTVHKLINVELKRLCGTDVSGEEIYIVDKVMRTGVDAVIGVRNTLRRELPDKVVIPKYVRVCGFAADGELHGFAAERWRTHPLTR